VIWIFFFYPTGCAISLALVVNKIARSTSFIADFTGSESMESRHNLNTP